MDAFALGPTFEVDGYDNEGKQLALKIYLKNMKPSDKEGVLTWGVV